MEVIRPFFCRFCSENDNRKQISVGIESSVRNLKKSNEVQMLLLANEVSPKWFGKHLIAMTISKNPNTKVIILPGMKDLTKEVLKVPSIVITIKRSADLSTLDEFYQKLDIHSKLLTHYHTIKTPIDLSINIKKAKRVSECTEEPPVFLLKKHSDSCRSFIPMETDEMKQEKRVTVAQENSLDYISLSKFTIGSSFLDTSSSPLYRPPKIMKLSGNPNRKQKNLKIKKT